MMQVKFIKINVPINASGGGQYDAGVIVRVEVVKTCPKLLITNKAWKSQSDFLAGADQIFLKDIPGAFSISHDDEFIGSGSWTTPQEFLWNGIPMAQKRIEGNRTSRKISWNYWFGKYWKKIWKTCTST